MRFDQISISPHNFLQKESGVIFVFVAELKSGKLISILHTSKKVISTIEKEGPFYCPSCKQELILKKGEKKTPHFAHKTTCLIKPEGETESHLHGKKTLFEWLQKQGLNPRLESYLPEINQRPDLLFHWNGRQTVIEFQCSVIPTKEMQKRTSNYLKHGYFPIWIIHDSLVNKSSYVFHLNDFISQFIYYWKSKPVILSFHQQKNEFVTYSNFIPFSTNRAICIEHRYDFNQSLDMLVQPQPLRIDFFPYWIAISEKWILRQSLFPDARKNKFLQFLYQRKLHPTSLPWEVGIPLPDTVHIETPPVEWQFYLWYFFLYTRKTGSVIHKDELPLFIRHKLNQYIRFRALSIYTEKEKFQPFINYFSFLTSLGFFKDIGDKLIVAKKPEILKQGNVDRSRRKRGFYYKNKDKILHFFI